MRKRSNLASVVQRCQRRWPPWLALAALCGATPAATAQDVSTIELLQPRSGCALSAAEPVRIRSVNYGPTLPGASIFSYRYSINGGPPVSETVFMGNPVPPNGTLAYTFVTPADLSLPGEYLIDAAIIVAADPNPANDAIGAQSVRNWAPSVGGTLAGPTGTTADGIVELGGQLGAIVEWQQATDGARWQSLENRTPLQGFAGLRQSTQFRAVVQNGPCAPALSGTARVSPDAIFANGFQP